MLINICYYNISLALLGNYCKVSVSGALDTLQTSKISISGKHTNLI